MTWVELDSIGCEDWLQQNIFHVTKIYVALKEKNEWLMIKSLNVLFVQFQVTGLSYKYLWHFQNSHCQNKVICKYSAPGFL